MEEQYILIKNNINIKEYPKYILNFINSLNKFNKNIDIYLNLKNSDGKKYLNKETSKLTLFFNGTKINNHKFDIITINSINNKFYNLKSIDNNRFEYINTNFIKFNENYNINYKGDIIIYLNNYSGWYKNDYINFDKKLIRLIEKIKSFKLKNKIKIRIHPKNKEIQLEKNKIFLNKLNKIIIKYKIEFDNQELYNSINNCYCYFIQNASLIIELLNIGVPLFNSNMISYNFYDVFIDINQLNKINYSLYDRKNLLKKYYTNLISIPDFENDYIIKLLQHNKLI